MTNNEGIIPDETYFHRTGDVFTPTALTRGPWDPNSLHGRVVAGLLMYEVQRKHLDPAFQVARITVDMFRVAPMLPVTVVTNVVRDGNRIRVADASLRLDDGLEIARASVVMLRRAATPEGDVWAPPLWDVPHPDTLETPPPPPAQFGPATWETRAISGRIGVGADADETPVQKRAWVRDLVKFVDDEWASPLVSAAMLSDFANPFANAGTRGLNYVNADASMYLHRDPTGEWIGIEVAGHNASEGIAVGEVVLYDLDGAFGRATVCGVANQHRR